MPVTVAKVLPGIDVLVSHHDARDEIDNTVHARPAGNGTSTLQVPDTVNDVLPLHYIQLFVLYRCHRLY